MKFDEKIHRGAVYRDAIEYYGAKNQVDVALEEMGELIQALMKERRCEEEWRRPDLRVHVAEEMADVEIMLEQLKIIFKNEEAVEQWRGAKIERLERRLDGRIKE